MSLTSLFVNQWSESSWTSSTETRWYRWRWIRISHWAWRDLR